MEKCPVCEMDVDPKTIKYKAEKDRTIYYFCTKACYDYFLEENKSGENQAKDNKKT